MLKLLTHLSKNQAGQVCCLINKVFADKQSVLILLWLILYKVRKQRKEKLELTFEIVFVKVSKFPNNFHIQQKIAIILLQTLKEQRKPAWLIVSYKSGQMDISDLVPKPLVNLRIILVVILIWMLVFLSKLILVPYFKKGNFVSYWRGYYYSTTAEVDWKNV